MNVAIAHYCKITEPIVVVPIGTSAVNLEIPSREFTAKNHVQVDFGGGLVYYISFQAGSAGGIFWYIMDISFLHDFSNKVYVHKMDPKYTAFEGKTAIPSFYKPGGSPSSILVSIIDPRKSRTPTIITDPNGSTFTVTVRIDPVSQDPKPSSVFVDVVSSGTKQ